MGKGSKPRHNKPIFDSKFPECSFEGCRRIKAKGLNTCLDHYEPCEDCGEAEECDNGCLNPKVGLSESICDLDTGLHYNSKER